MNTNELANYYGFDIIDVSNLFPYNQRKGKTYALKDRRSKEFACTYSCKKQIYEHIVKLYF